MAKRANPFTEDFMPQSKTHVGLKQFNNNEDRLQKVYEKTLELLFRGAKKLPDDVICKDHPVGMDRKDGKKQLIISKDGTLLHDVVAPVDVALQQPCLCGSLLVDSPCAYCETPLCGLCQHYCKHCQLPYCSQCSLVGSEDLEICVSCNR